MMAALPLSITSSLLRRKEEEKKNVYNTALSVNAAVEDLRRRR